jgi:hypothetical protein
LSSASTAGRTTASTSFGRERQSSHCSPVATGRTPAVTIDDHYGWGLGVGLQTGGAEDAIWQWGDNNPHRALAIFYRQSKTGVVVVAEGAKANRTFSDIAHQAVGGSQ